MLPVGKLPPDILDSLLKRCAIKDDRIKVGPAVGEDAAVIDTGGPRYLIAKTDPITSPPMLSAGTQSISTPTT